MKAYFISATSLVGAGAVQLCGGYDKLFSILLVVVVLDYLTGILKAIYTKTLNSTIGFKGLIKKVMMFTIVALAVALDKLYNTAFLRDGVIFAFIINESISILENTGEVIPIPPIIKQFLDKLKDGRQK